MKVQRGLVIASVLMVFLLPVRPQSTQQTANESTMDKTASVSVIRIEPIEHENGFIGYAEGGVSIVEPDKSVRVVLYGRFLDEIDVIGFTTTDNCSDVTLRIEKSDFAIQADKRIEVMYQFESDSLHKLCTRQKPSSEYLNQLPFHLNDDTHCWVSTNLPPRFLPLTLHITIIVVLLALSALFSSLNQGLMSLTPQELTLIKNSGSENERRFAQTILPVRKLGNRLMCSLLICNVCVNSAISILMGDLTSGTIALIVSSAGIAIYGEIVPQVLCVKRGLAVAAYTIWVTRFFMVLTFVVSYPISLVLNKLCGEQFEPYDRKRLIELIKMNTKDAPETDETKIVVGALEMNDKIVKDIMTKIEDVFMINEDFVLNTHGREDLYKKGFTRVPVYSGRRDNVVALLFVKDLALSSPEDNLSVSDVCEHNQHPVRRVLENTPLRTMLDEFKKGDYHLALVDRLVPQADDKEGKHELVGLVTLEDILEEILQAEIVDETDVLTDNVRRRKVRELATPSEDWRSQRRMPFENRAKSSLDV